MEKQKLQPSINSRKDMFMKTYNSEVEIKREDKRKIFIEAIDKNELAENFPLFTDRQELVRYLVRYELFKKVLDVKGSIVECGVYKGASLMFFAHLSAIYEPYAFNREIVGFDTFEGFPSVNEKDGSFAYVGDLGGVNFETIKKSIDLYDMNRPIGHVPKVKLVKGDAMKTIPEYFRNNPYSLVSLLYLDFDLYEPTKIAIETILPRMPKGAILAFDELNDKRRQGETVALLECLKINDYKINKFPEEPHISYFQI